MARITLDEVRTLVRSDPNYAKWRKGEDTNLYVLIGPAEGVRIFTAKRAWVPTAARSSSTSTKRVCYAGSNSSRAGLLLQKE